MSIITIFRSKFAEKEPMITSEIVKRTGYKIITDKDIAAYAEKHSGIKAEKILSVFTAKTSVFNKFTHDKERGVAWLRHAVSEMLSEDNLIIEGFSGILIPKSITHALRICLVADFKSRLDNAVVKEKFSEKEALNTIHTVDEQSAVWMNSLFNIRDPWNPSLYDIVIPTDKMSIDQSVKLIEDNLRNEVLYPTESSNRAAKDFILAAKVGVELAENGHNVDIYARDGAVTITINKNVLMLSRLKEELKSLAQKTEGVVSVETRIGKGFHQTDIYRKYDFNIPKLLIVDDEREFIHTLSERLKMRDIDSALAYDGETAINILNNDEPEVMLLDLKMPGIDGIEVLRKTKQTRPDVEVVILTGHGSEEDRKKCMELGAFAYLQKPVDIDILTETLNKANEKMKTSRLKQI
ncbi:MAG: response regulator [Deltaproteobacteria bacterium]|nr:response regulator [Deltaproteobacteria bacterium]